MHVSFHLRVYHRPYFLPIKVLFIGLEVEPLCEGSRVQILQVRRDVLLKLLIESMLFFWLVMGGGSCGRFRESRVLLFCGFDPFGTVVLLSQWDECG